VLTEMGQLTDAGCVAFSQANAPLADTQVLWRALQYAATFGYPVWLRPEDAWLAKGGVAHDGEVATRLGLPGIPPFAETIAAATLLELVRATRARVHVCRLSTAGGAELMRQAKQEGLPVTCDTAPPYFSLNENEIGDYRTFAKLSPPLRGESDRRAIAAAVAEGIIDCIASDHSPHDVESKRVPFAQAAAGGIGLETLLPVSLGLTHNRSVSLSNLLKCMTSRPAEILGLPQGRLAKGAPADIAIIDLEHQHKIDLGAFHSKSKNSPYDGRQVQGAVRRTFVDGRQVFAAQGAA
jgi:dihydroorotase